MQTIIAIAIAVIVGLGIAWAGGQGGVEIPLAGTTVSLFLLCGLAAYAVNWLVYVPAVIFQTEKFYDLTGSLTYLTLIAVACWFSAPLDLRSTIVAALVAIWALRLGSFLFRRISADGKDVRFDKIKTNPLRFLMTWTLQGAWVILTAASALVIITNNARPPVDVFMTIGVAMWVAGFLIEVVADNQKSAFRKVPENKGRFINTGLWALSRHPNYFGEILLWSGITVVSLPLLSGWQWATIISPFFVTFLLTRVSGIPMLERTGKQRWGDDPDYQAYVKNTPVLVPRPPRI